MTILADFLFGLLSVSRLITEEFQRHGANWRQVNLSLLLFLRSDIFSYIMSEARERDKLTFTKPSPCGRRPTPPSNREIGQRRADGQITADEVWVRFFEELVDGIPTKDYLVSRILPRPRDVIYLCKAALLAAVSHRHARISKTDITQAEKYLYSKYAFNALEAETSPQIPRVEDFLYELAGSSAVVTEGELCVLAKKVGLPTTTFRDDRPPVPQVCSRALRL